MDLNSQHWIRILTALPTQTPRHLLDRKSLNWSWIISRIDRAWLYKGLKIWDCHGLADWLSEYGSQNSNPVMVAVVSSNPTGGNLITIHVCSTREGNIYTWKCLSVHHWWGGTLSQVWVGGYPIPGLDGGGYPVPGLENGGGGTPSQVWMVGGILHPRSGWWGVSHPRSG